jgi:hypothetical protein
MYYLASFLCVLQLRPFDLFVLFYKSNTNSNYFNGNIIYIHMIDVIQVHIKKRLHT